MSNLEVKDIPVSEIKPFFYNMRIETRNGDPELMDSIKAHGLMQPVLLRPLKPSGYQLIAGSRRLDAFKKLDRKVIPSIIRDIDDRTAFELALGEISLMTVSAKVDFPQPDSPTTPTTSPYPTSKSTPSMALMEIFRCP